MLCNYLSNKIVVLNCSDGNLPVTGYGTGLSYLNQCDADNKAYFQAQQNASVLRNLNPCIFITGTDFTSTSIINSFVLSSTSGDFVSDVGFTPDGLNDDCWLLNVTFPVNGGILEKIRITKNIDDLTPQYAWSTTNVKFNPLESYDSFLPLMAINYNILNSGFEDILGVFYGQQNFLLAGPHKSDPDSENPFRLETVIDGISYVTTWPISDGPIAVGNIDNILNIDFNPTGASGISMKSGLAVVGFSNSDFWNSRGSGYTGNLPYTHSNYPLNYVDNTLSPITNGTLPFNAVFSGYNNFNDPMFKWAAKLQGGVQLENIPPGYYDLYVYAISFPQTPFTVTAQANSGPVYSDVIDSSLIAFYNDNVWRQNVEYVKFRMPIFPPTIFQTGSNLLIQSDGIVDGFINGLQLIKYGTGHSLISPTPSPSAPPYVNTNISSLINVNFGATGTGAYKVGLAFTGITNNDFWNNRHTGLALPLSFFDGSTSNVKGMHSPNSILTGYFNSFDPMYSTFNINNAVPNRIFTQFSGFNSGLYDIYLYGHGETGVKNLNVNIIINPNGNAISLGEKQTSPSNSAITSSSWAEYLQFVRYPNVLLSPGDILSLNWLGYLNGAQFFQTSGIGLTGYSSGEPSQPSAALNLYISGSTQNTISLGWTDIYPAESGFKIERKGSFYQEIGRVPANTTSFTDTFLMPGASYCYRVRGFDTGNYGYSNEVCGSSKGACYSTLVNQSQIPLAAGNSGVYMGYGHVKIALPSGCDWSAITDNNWVFLSDTASIYPNNILPVVTGVGSGSVIYVVESNYTNLTRKGRLLVNGNYLDFYQSNI